MSLIPVLGVVGEQVILNSYNNMCSFGLLLFVLSLLTNRNLYVANVSFFNAESISFDVYTCLLWHLMCFYAENKAYST